MVNDDKEKLQFWVKNWDETSEFLKKLRHEKIRTINTANSIQILDSAYRSAVRNRVVGKNSGLVEFQSLIRKMKKND